MKDALGSIQSLVVLGGSSDIGAAIARKLVSSRTRTVVLGGRDQSRMDDLARELQAPMRTVEVVHFDALESSRHAEFVSDLFDRSEDIDVVVLAFGLLAPQQELMADVDKALEMANTNYTGSVSVGLRVANRLRRQGHGSLVVLSSVAAERPRRSNFLYGSSKAGLDAFAQGLHDELRDSGVQVLVVRPGFVHTKMTAGMKTAPLATTAEAVALSVVEGLRNGAHTVWVPSMLRWVMVALRHLPRSIFRKLDL